MWWTNAGHMVTRLISRIHLLCQSLSRRTDSSAVRHHDLQPYSVGAVRVCWAWVEDCDGKNNHLHTPVLRGAQHALRYFLRHAMRQILSCVLHVLVLHVLPKGGPRAPNTKVRGRYEYFDFWS